MEHLIAARTSLSGNQFHSGKEVSAGTKKAGCNVDAFWWRAYYLSFAMPKF